MSKLNKKLLRLKQRPKDYKFNELKGLLEKLGFTLYENTRGSKVLFYNEKTQKRLVFHKPHKGRPIDLYIIDEVLKVLKEEL